MRVAGEPEAAEIGAQVTRIFVIHQANCNRNRLTDPDQLIMIAVRDSPTSTSINLLLL